MLEREPDFVHLLFRTIFRAPSDHNAAVILSRFNVTFAGNSRDWPRLTSFLQDVQLTSSEVQRMGHLLCRSMGRLTNYPNSKSSSQGRLSVFPLIAIAASIYPRVADTGYEGKSILRQTIACVRLYQCEGGVDSNTKTVVAKMHPVRGRRSGAFQKPTMLVLSSVSIILPISSHGHRILLFLQGIATLWVRNRQNGPLDRARRNEDSFTDR